jgi:hypothetical protein
MTTALHSSAGTEVLYAIKLVRLLSISAVVEPLIGILDRCVTTDHWPLNGGIWAARFVVAAVWLLTYVIRCRPFLQYFTAFILLMLWPR